MVVGTGLISILFKKYNDNDNILLFASGVSDSSCIDEIEYDKEINLLKTCVKQYQNKMFIYFSSCDVANISINNLMYYKHKLKIEKYIQENVKNFYIFRLPQLFGLGGNKKNLINFLFTSIKNETSFTLCKGTYKNIIDANSAFKICSYIIDNTLSKNMIINITNTHYYSVEQIVETIERILNKVAIYKEKFVVQYFKYDEHITNDLLVKCNINFENNFLYNKLYEYYLMKELNEK